MTLDAVCRSWNAYLSKNYQNSTEVCDYSVIKFTDSSNKNHLIRIRVYWVKNMLALQTKLETILTSKIKDTKSIGLDSIELKTVIIEIAYEINKSDSFSVFFSVMMSQPLQDYWKQFFILICHKNNWEKENHVIIKARFDLGLIVCYIKKNLAQLASSQSSSIFQLKSKTVYQVFW